jgi:hypothetical protein
VEVSDSPSKEVGVLNQLKMKSFILSMLLIATITGLSMASVPFERNLEGPKITITIEFGKKKPDGSCALAFGICEVDVSLGVLGYIEVGEGGGGGGGGSWILTLPRESVTRYAPQVLPYLDGKNQVTFSETFTFPSSVRKQLGSVEDIILQANSTYPMTFENGNYVIRF